MLHMRRWPTHATAAQSALVAGWSENHLQDGGSHIQSPVHCNASLSQPTLEPRNCVQNLRSTDTTPLLRQPFTKTDLTRRGFHYSAPAVWNSLPRTLLESPSITVLQCFGWIIVKVLEWVDLGTTNSRLNCRCDLVPGFFEFVERVNELAPLAYTECCIANMWLEWSQLLRPGLVSKVK